MFLTRIKGNYLLLNIKPKKKQKRKIIVEFFKLLLEKISGRMMRKPK
jgi:hypothetical protein